mmetsp:Transcript_402/g.922  ORF Transcript_402/g.922 Transcript_402/m.922 type:complete len:314 (-) Transcript_402:270-1211(-)
MSGSITPTRKNGLSPPHTPAQISTWIFLPILVVEFLLVVFPVLPRLIAILCTILFLGLAGAAVGCAYMTMKIDPSDPRLLNSREHNNEDENSNGSQRPRWDPQDPTKQCWICDVQVGVKSMHCKFCNKCVDHFDHHCMWLNTCVGKANYRYFFRTLVCVKLMLLVQTVVQIGLILDIFLGKGSSKENAKNWFTVETHLPVVIIMGIFIFLDIASLSLIGQLLVFHLKLQKEGLSTYEYIVRDNQKRREQTQKMNELQQRRKAEISKAKDEGNGCLVVRLEKGGILREKFGISCCDPLSPDGIESNGHTEGHDV